MPYFLIAVNTPNAPDLAEELGQRLLGKQIVKGGFPLTAYDSHATLEFPDIAGEVIEKIEVEASSWIAEKHRSLRLRRLSGKRQKQNLGTPAEREEEIICAEIRK